MPTPTDLSISSGVVDIDMTSGDGGTFHLSTTDDVDSWTISNALDGDTFLLKVTRNAGHVVDWSGLADVWLGSNAAPYLAENQTIWFPLANDNGTWVAQVGSAGAASISEVISGVDPTGTSDSSAAVQAWFDSVPARVLPLDISGWAEGLLPGVQSDGSPAVYRFDSTVVVDDGGVDGQGRQFELRSNGARIVNNTGTDLVFDLETASMSRHAILRGLVIIDGCVRITGSNRDQIGLRECKFNGSPDYAVQFTDTSSTTGEFGVIFPVVLDCDFYECAGAFDLDTGSAAVGYIDRCKILYSSQVPIKIHSTNAYPAQLGQDWRLGRVNFEQVIDHTVEGGSEVPCFIHIAHNVGRIHLDHVRCGAEGEAVVNGVAYKKPRHDIICGDLTTPSASEYVTDIHINPGCQFLGVGDALQRDSTTAASAILFNGRPYDCHIADGTKFQEYDDGFIEQAWTATPSGADRNYVGWLSNASAATVFVDGKDGTWIDASSGIPDHNHDGSYAAASHDHDGDYAPLSQSINTQTGASYTLVLADAGKIVEGDRASAQTVTVPPNSSVAFPTGTRVDLTQYGAGAVTVAAGAGVTIRSLDGNLELAGKYAAATLYKRATNEWVLIGALA